MPHFAGGPNGPLLPEIRDMFPDAPFIPRSGEINAWDSTDFVNAVKVGKADSQSLRHTVLYSIRYAALDYKNPIKPYSTACQHT